MDILDATLEDLKAARPDLYKLLYKEISKEVRNKLKPAHLRIRKQRKKATEEAQVGPVKPPRDLKRGDRVRWLPTEEEGTILRLEACGIKTLGLRRVIVELDDGTQTRWYDNAKLLIVIE